MTELERRSEREFLLKDMVFDYDKPGSSTAVIFGSYIECEHDDFSPDGSKDEFVLPRIQKNQSKKPRGYAAYRQTMQRIRSKAINGRETSRRARGRGNSSIDRAEMLSQHAKIVDELHEEDFERGLTKTQSRKTVRDRNLPLLSKVYSRFT